MWNVNIEFSLGTTAGEITSLVWYERSDYDEGKPFTASFWVTSLKVFSVSKITMPLQPMIDLFRLSVTVMRDNFNKYRARLQYSRQSISSPSRIAPLNSAFKILGCIIAAGGILGTDADADATAPSRLSGGRLGKFNNSTIYVHHM